MMMVEGLDRNLSLANLPVDISLARIGIGFLSKKHPVTFLPQGVKQLTHQVVIVGIVLT